jgi:hypothetical protein
MESSEAVKWKKAIDAELLLLKKAETWTVKKPISLKKKPVGCKWVFTKKLDKNGNMKRLKI